MKVSSMKKHGTLTYLKNIIFPCLLFSALTGIFTGAFIFGFKYVSNLVIRFSGDCYAFLSLHPLWILLAVFVVALLAFLMNIIGKYCPHTRGGGIPTAIAILRGLFSFHWLKNLIGTCIASLSTFFIGVPLGNEGPCVQMGTAIGKGTVGLFGRKNRAWDRYVMTGGASCGFAVATGAPVSGIFFALEEAHQRFSPMIILTACTSVMFGVATTYLLSQWTGISVSLFGTLEIIAFSLQQIWIPVVIGIAIGFFAVLFGKLYQFMNHWIVKRGKIIPSFVKVLLIYLITFGMGFVSTHFIGTGHHLILDIMEGNIVWYLLIAILLFRSVLSIAANQSGLTGGLFIPILSLGAILASLLGKGFIAIGWVEEEYYLAIVMTGIAACLGGMIKAPITAIVFSIEALTGLTNLLFTIIAVTISYLITEIFKISSINENVLEDKMEEMHEGKERLVVDIHVVVQAHAFVIGKSVRDIFWPNNLFVLSVKPSHKVSMIDASGGKTMHEGDILHIRFQTYDLEQTKKELFYLIGEQEWVDAMVPQG